MKLKYILPTLCILFLMSCTKDDDEILPVNEIGNLVKVTEMTNDTHTLELYTKNGTFYTGYNNISLRIKNNVDDSFIETATIHWMPMMQMPNMQHSCPKSEIVKRDGSNTVFNGSVVFQMTGMNGAGWSMKFSYAIDGVDYEVENAITVLQSEKQNVTSFIGSDDVKYILALAAPTTPEIAINDITVGLYKMESMMSFLEVPACTIMLDPRMPSMGNHSSPNNENLTYDVEEKMYNGKLSLTMSGYWVLNLKLKNNEGTILKGEDVTEENERSNLFLELEF